MPDPSPAARAVAIFDSGLGGLSVAQHIRKRLPDEALTYFADCGFAPYGHRSEDEILARVLKLGRWLTEQPVKALVVACNTATTIAIAALRKEYPHLPIVGVEPGVKPAVARSRSGVVGVLATQATLANRSFQVLLARQSQDCRFVCQAGHGLVALIEAGQLESPEMDRLLRAYLDGMAGEGVDTLVLGCTHFPLLVPAIERLYGDRFALVHTGDAVSARLQALLVQDVDASRQACAASWHRDGEPTFAPGPIRLVASSDSAPLVQLAQALLGAPLTLEIALAPPPERMRA